jgi:hypothetical protein
MISWPKCLQSQVMLVSFTMDWKNCLLVNQSGTAQFSHEPMSKHLLESTLMMIISLILRLVFRAYVNNYIACRKYTLIPCPYHL